MDNLTLIIPAKNEKESLPIVLEELKPQNLNIIIVLEPTDIETINSIKNYKCKIVKQINKGYGDAIILGIENVETEYYCIFNADGSFDPKELKNMMNYTISKNLDFLFGSRYMTNGGSEDDTIVTFIGNKIFSFLGNLLFRLNISDILYTYVIGSTLKSRYLNLKSKDFTFCVELPIKSKKNNFKLGDISSYERKRIAGRKKVNAFKDGFLILMAIIKLYFS